MGKIHTKTTSLTSNTYHALTQSFILTNHLQSIFQQDSFTLIKQDYQPFEITIQCITPCITISKTPFQKYLNTTILFQSNYHFQDQTKQNKTLLLSQTFLKQRILYHQNILMQIFQYLTFQDFQTLSQCSKRMKQQVTLYYLNKQYNWDLTQFKIQPLQNNQSYLKYSTVQQQSQHSLDLDRSLAFISCESQNGEKLDLVQQQSKLDRVLRGLSFSIGYFQGLNSISAIMLGFYSQQKAYWMIRYLVYKSENLANNNKKYEIFMDRLDQMVKTKVPQVYDHLEINCFNVQYFAMRWILALFSYDLQKEQVLKLWDLIYTFGNKMLMIFIVCLLQQQKQKILLNHGDKLNDLLKHKFNKYENTIQRGQFENIFKRVKNMFIQEQYGSNQYKQQNLKIKKQQLVKDIEILLLQQKQRYKQYQVITIKSNLMQKQPGTL